MRTVTTCLQLNKDAGGKMLMNECPHPFGSNEIVGTLQNESRDSKAGEISTVIGKERDPREMLGDFRVGPAKAFSEF